MMYIHRVKPMVRKQVYLTPAQNQRLRRAAAKQRRSEAEIIREAIDRQLGGETLTRAEIEKDPLWGIIAIAHSGDPDFSKNVDHYLYGAPRKK